MKKVCLILALSLLGIGQMAAQESDYTPFVREGVQWVCYYDNYQDFDVMGFQPGQTYFTLEIKCDAVIEGKEYKAMHKYSGIGVNPDDDTVLAYLREENRIVYAIIPDGMANSSFMVGYGNPLYCDIIENAKAGEEIILYEFNDTESYYYGILNHNDISMLTYLGVDKVDGKRQNHLQGRQL